MANREKLSVLKIFQHIKPDAYDATETPAEGVSLKGFDSALVELNVGAPGVTFSATDKITATLEHSDLVGSEFVAVPKELILLESGAAAADGAFIVLDADAKANKNHKAAYLGNKEYLRCVLTFAGTHGTETVMAVNIIGGHPYAAPVV
jgi:hypothetical protein